MGKTGAVNGTLEMGWHRSWIRAVCLLFQGEPRGAPEGFVHGLRRPMRCCLVLHNLAHLVQNTSGTDTQSV